MMSNHTTTIQLEPWHQLSGKVVMITGASSGLGKEFCLDLAKAGCKIVAAARRVDRLKVLCDQINQLSYTSDCCSNSVQLKAVPLVLDLHSDGAAIEVAVTKAWEAFGRIDCLINNAGVRGRVHTPLDLSEEEWESTIKTNMTGNWLVSKYVCLRMRDADQGGCIIFISSIAGLPRGPVPRAFAYSSSKVAVNAMAKIMAMELGKYKIRVNSISPGLFKSEITEHLLQKSWVNIVAQRAVPLRTFGTADPALTSLIRYLIHDSSEYVSGNIFTVDAGTSIPGVPIFSSL